MKATKMAFVVFASGGIFSKVVFMLVPKDTYHPIPFVSQLLFVMLSDISHHLWMIIYLKFRNLSEKGIYFSETP